MEKGGKEGAKESDRAREKQTKRQYGEGSRRNIQFLFTFSRLDVAQADGRCDSHLSISLFPSVEPLSCNRQHLCAQGSSGREEGEAVTEKRFAVLSAVVRCCLGRGRWSLGILSTFSTTRHIRNGRKGRKGQIGRKRTASKSSSPSSWSYRALEQSVKTGDGATTRDQLATHSKTNTTTMRVFFTRLLHCTFFVRFTGPSLRQYSSRRDVSAGNLALCAR